MGSYNQLWTILNRSSKSRIFNSSQLILSNHLLDSLIMSLKNIVNRKKEN